MLGLDFYQIIILCLIFIWTGFVRSGLGFGGAALGLPLLLFIIDSPIIWLPIISCHLLFFASLTLASRIKNVDWKYLFYSLKIMIVPILIGVFGLITINDRILSLLIYSITMLYASLWVFSINLNSKSKIVDTFMLIIGGYVGGTSLTGAPFIVAVYTNNINKHLLRNTLFVLWFVMVSIKLATFISFNVPVNFQTAVYLLPFAFIGHLIGLKFHEKILENDNQIKIYIGLGLIAISVVGLINLIG